MSKLVHTQLALFEELEEAAKPVEYDREYWRETVPCHHCGEPTVRSVYDSNHGAVFNGWCVKRLLITGRIHTFEKAAELDAQYSTKKRPCTSFTDNLRQDLAWLESHGFNPWADRHDPANFDLAGVELYEAKHSGRGNGVE